MQLSSDTKPLEVEGNTKEIGTEIDEKLFMCIN